LADRGVGCTAAGTLRRDGSGFHVAPDTGERDARNHSRLLLGPLADRLHSLERKLIINNTPPADVQFSHPLAEQAQNGTSTSYMAHDNLFREPEFAPGTPRPDVDVDEPAPASHQHDAKARPRRTPRRRTAA
jgi:hypothetical protein